MKTVQFSCAAIRCETPFWRVRQSQTVAQSFFRSDLLEFPEQYIEDPDAVVIWTPVMDSRIFISHSFKHCGVVRPLRRPVGLVISPLEGHCQSGPNSQSGFCFPG